MTKGRNVVITVGFLVLIAAVAVLAVIATRRSAVATQPVSAASPVPTQTGSPTASMSTPMPPPSSTAAATPRPNAANQLALSGVDTGNVTVSAITVTCGHATGGLLATQMIASGEVGGKSFQLVINKWDGDGSVTVSAFVGTLLPGWNTAAPGTASSVGLTNFDISKGGTVDTTVVPDSANLGQTTPSGPLTIAGQLVCP